MKDEITLARYLIVVKELLTTGSVETAIDPRRIVCGERVPYLVKVNALKCRVKKAYNLVSVSQNQTQEGVVINVTVQKNR